MNSSIQWTVLASAAFIVLLLPTALGRHAPVQSHSEINKPNLLNVNVEESKASTPVGKDTKDAIFKSSVSAEPHVRAEGSSQEQKMLEIAGSSLPYCAHACGACSPCRRVAVSFKCSLAEGSESCPMAYRCMCRGKTFPIP